MSSTTQSPSQPHLSTRPWLARLHPGLFGIPLGLLGLSSSWQRLAYFGWDFSSGIAHSLLMVALTILGILLLLSTAKLIAHPSKYKQEFTHPVLGALMALMPVSCLIAVVILRPTHPEWQLIASVVIGLCLMLQAAIAWQIVAQLSTGQMPAELISPALYVPIVPGGFVGAMALNSIGLPGFAMLLMGMGVGGWALLEMRILNRLFSGPLLMELRPTLGIEIAPAAVGGLAMATIWPDLSTDFIMIGLGIASGPMLAVLTRWRWWSATPFSANFWSFSFPLAAVASSVVEAVRRGAWPPAVAYVAVLLVSSLVLFLAVRTLILLLTGRLLPQI